MKKNIRNFYIQPLLFSMIKLDETTPSFVEGIVFDNTTHSDVGLIFIQEQKILFMHANIHLSAQSIVDSLLDHRDWLGANYHFHIITPISENPESSESKEKDLLNFFVRRISECLDRAEFKYQSLKQHTQNNPKITINRKGEISTQKVTQKIELGSDVEIRKAINHLNYFNGIDERKNKFSDFTTIINSIGISRSMDNAYMHLDLQYDRTLWTELPQLNALTAMAARYFKRASFKVTPTVFFESLREHMPTEIAMRIDYVLFFKSFGSIFNLNEIYEKFKIVCTYYDSLLKKATGFLSQNAVQAYKSGDYISSEKFARAALNIITVSGSLEALSVAHYNLGASLMQQKRYEEAIKELTFAKEVYQKLDNSETKVAKYEEKIKNCEVMRNLEVFNKYHHMHPIHEAARNNDLKIIKELFEENPNSLLETDDYGWTPLTYAVFFRASLDIIKFILEKSPQTAREAYYGQFTEEDTWDFNLNISECDIKYSLLRFSLYTPKKFQSLVVKWDEKTQVEVVSLLLQAAPNIFHFQKSDEEENENCSDLKYALIKKVPTSVIQLLIEKMPGLIEKTESLTTAILSGTEEGIIQRLIEMDLEGSGGTSEEHGITPIFAAVYANASPHIVKLLLNSSPKAVLQLTGSRFLSGFVGGEESEDSEDSVEYISVPNTSILIYALENKQFKLVDLLLDRVPALASLPDEKQKKPIDIVEAILTAPRLQTHEKEKMVILRSKIILCELLGQLTGENINKVVRLQALTRGYISRKHNGLPQLKSQQWSLIKQKADNLIFKLAEANRYFEISELTGFIYRNRFFSALDYMRQLKWLDNFPNEIIYKIFKFLNGIDLIKFSQVSKRYFLLLKDELIWKQKIEQELTNLPIVMSSRNYAEQYRKMLKGQDPLSPYDDTQYDTRSSYYRFLVEKNHRWSKNELTAFLNSAVRLRTEKWVLTLLQAGAIPTIRTFERAMYEGASNCAKSFLQYGLNVNSQGTPNSFIMGNSSTLFHITFTLGNLEMLNFLFRQPGITVLPQLHQMAALGNLEVLKKLLDEGEDVNQKDLNNYTAIFWAVAMGQITILKELMSRRATLYNESNIFIKIQALPHYLIIDNHHRLNSLITLAVLYKQIEAARMLIEKVAERSRCQLPDIEIRTLEGPTISLLQLVAESGDLEAIKFLLSFKRLDGSLPAHNPLVFAAKQGHTACLHYLIQQGFAVNECIQLNYLDGDGALVRTSETPLGVAAEQGYLECIKLLLTAGANPNQSYKQYYYQKSTEPPSLRFDGLPIHKLAQYITNPKALEKNELSSPDFNLPSSKDTPLISRAVESLSLLITTTKNIDHIDASNDQTVLSCLVSSRELHLKDKIKKENYNRLIIYCIQRCLEAGADINHRYGYSKKTVLHEAAQKGRIELLEFLLENGADFEIKDKDGKTPIMLATETCRNKLKEAASLMAIVKPSQSHSDVNNVLLFSRTVTPLGFGAQQKPAEKLVEATTSKRNDRRNKKNLDGKQ